MPQTVLVCGGAGYIGSHVVLALLKSDFHVVVVDNLSTGHRDAVDEERVAFFQVDIRDAAAMARVFDSIRIDAVVHMCADSLVGQSMTNPLKYYDNNVYGAIQLLKAMQRARVKTIVFSSTAAVFGVPEKVPIMEGDPKLPTTPYGETKLAIERMLKWADEAHGIKNVTLRYFNAAGAEAGAAIGERHNPETHLIPIVLNAALVGSRVKIFGTDYGTRDGSCIRDYIHVSDLATAHVQAIAYLLRVRKSNTFNLGSGKGYSVREVIDTCRTVTGVHIPADESSRRQGDPPVLIATSKKAHRLLGWTPTLSLEEMCRSAWSFHRANHQNAARM